MTATTIRVQMAQRKDTAANWTAANPILLSGEIGYETDTKKFKIGDGTTNWNSLAYLPIPDGSGNLTITGNLEIGTTGTLTFEGSTADGFETTLAVTDPTADRTITLPDVSGTVITTGDTGSVTSAMLADGTIVDADVSATAEIAVSKLANGTANQVLVTDGTDVSWSDDLTLAGNLTVNGTTTTIDTTTLVVEDKNIELGVVDTPTDTTADGGGITLKGTTDKTINWVDATDSWTSSEHVDLASGKSYRINGTEVLSSTTLGSGVTGSSLTSVGTLGSLTVTGSATAGTFIPTSSTVPTNGVYLPAANSVAISTSGEGQLFVDASGNVGVGTANASGLFHVANTGTAGTTADNLSVFFSSANRNATVNIIAKNTEASTLNLGDADSSSVGRIVYDHASNYMAFSANTDERLRITSSGQLLVGTVSARTVEYTPGTAGVPKLQVQGNDGGSSQILITDTRVDGRHPQLAFAKTRNGAIVVDDDILGSIGFFGDDGTDTRTWGGRITCEVDGGTSVTAGSFVVGRRYKIATVGTTDFTLIGASANTVGVIFQATGVGAGTGTATTEPYANSMPGRLVFSTTADGASSPTERMRITSGGIVGIGNLGATNTGSAQSGVPASFWLSATGTTSNPPAEFYGNATSTRHHVTFSNGNGVVGSISTNASATAYNTSSDYRLKENVVEVTDGITRLQQLKPSRFNFIADPDKTIDGFLAHEVQTIVPEAITGEKDAVDDEGNPIYQGIDQSKLVPLLTAALQEAVAEINALKDRLTAAGI